MVDLASVSVTEAFDLGDDRLLVRGTVAGYWATGADGQPLAPISYSSMTVAQLQTVAADNNVVVKKTTTKPQLITALAAAGFVDDPGTLQLVEGRGWMSAMTNHFDGPDVAPADYDEDGNRKPDVAARSMTDVERLTYWQQLIATSVPDDAIQPAAPIPLEIPA